MIFHTYIPKTSQSILVSVEPHPNHLVSVEPDPNHLVSVEPDANHLVWVEPGLNHLVEGLVPYDYVHLIFYTLYIYVSYMQ